MVHLVNSNNFAFSAIMLIANARQIDGVNDASVIIIDLLSEIMSYSMILKLSPPARMPSRFGIPDDF